MWKRFSLTLLAGLGFSAAVLASPTNLTAQQDDEMSFVDREAANEIARLGQSEEVLGLDQRGRGGRGFSGGNRGFNRGNRGGFSRGNRGFNRGYGYRYPGHRYGGYRGGNRAWYNYGYYRYPADYYPGYNYGYRYNGQWLCAGASNGGGVEYRYTSTDYNAAYNAAFSACVNAGQPNCVVSCQRQ